MAKSKRKKTAGKKTSRKKTPSSRSTARKKTTKKKKASRRSARRTGGRKSPTRKSPTKKKKKKTASRKKTTARGKKKTTARKKSTARKPAKKKTRRKKKAAKKKSTRKKAAAKKRKKTTKKAAARSKTKTKKKKAASATTKKKFSGKKAPTAKTTKKKAANTGASRSKTLSKKRGRSVAEVASGAQTDDQGYVFINGRRVRMISTQGKVIPKKKHEKVEQIPSEQQDPPKKSLKTPLSRKELNHYKRLLMIKRAELVGDLSAMEAEALRSNVGNISHMPIHMADIGTDAYEQDFMLGLAEAERKQIREIDEALQRIEDKIYGVCLHTGNPIPKARLDAKPWARYTIEAARIMESQQH